MKKAIYALALILCIGFVNAATVFQDKADWRSCGLDPYNLTIIKCGAPDKTVDSNWSTSQVATQYMDLAYVKPACATNATWVIKDSTGTHEYPIPKECFDYTPNTYATPENNTIAPYIFLDIAPQGGWAEKGIPPDSYMAECWINGEPTFGGGGTIVKNEELGVNVLYEEGIRWETKCPAPALKKATKLKVCYNGKCMTLYSGSSSVFTQTGDEVKIDFKKYESKFKDFIWKLRQML